jgi:hypothetical protein
MRTITKFLCALTLLSGTFHVRSQNNNALSFNSAQDVNLPYSTALDFSINSKFTVECWVKTSASTGIIFSNMVNAAPYNGYDVGVVNGKFRFAFNEVDPTSWLYVETVNSVNDGQWHHVASVYKGIPNANSVDLYIDGVLQTKTIIANNLSGPTNNPNPAHIGSRNNTAYFLNGVIDELRVWGKPLCVAEIAARMNCQMTGNEIGLLAYYNFNQGVAGANNAGLTSLPDLTGNNQTGILTAFALNGQTSNWVAPPSALTGTCQLFNLVSISGNTAICVGQSVTYSASGATTYTWNTQANTSTIAVSPIISTTYTVSGINSNNGCTGTASITVQVSHCTNIQHQEAGSKPITVWPNPANGIYNISGLENGTVIEVYDYTGKLLFNTVPGSENLGLDLSSQPDGIYILNCRNERGQRTYRLIKEE